MAPPRRSPSPWAVVLLLAMAGCGYERDLPTTPKPPSPPAPPAQAGIRLTVSPSPIEAAVPADGGAPWSASWTLGIQETSGIGGTIELVSATLTDEGGGTLAQTQLDAGQLEAQLGGSNRIRGGANQGLAMSLSFTFPEDSPSGTLHVSLDLTDDRGNRISSSVDDVVQICVPTLLAPEAGAKLDNGCSSVDNGVLWEFDWSDCPNADAYEIYVRQPSLTPLDVSTLTASSYTVLEDRVVPEEYRHGWYWKVRAKVNGTWGAWSPDRAFEVEPVNTDCVRP